MYFSFFSNICAFNHCRLKPLLLADLCGVFFPRNETINGSRGSRSPTEHSSRGSLRTGSKPCSGSKPCNGSNLCNRSEYFKYSTYSNFQSIPKIHFSKCSNVSQCFKFQMASLCF